MTAIVHVNINNIINNDSSTKVKNLASNLKKKNKKKTIKLKKYCIKNGCLSGFVFTASVNLPLLNQMNCNEILVP